MTTGQGRDRGTPQGLQLNGQVWCPARCPRWSARVALVHGRTPCQLFGRGAGLPPPLNSMASRQQQAARGRSLPTGAAANEQGAGVGMPGMRRGRALVLLLLTARGPLPLAALAVTL